MPENSEQQENGDGGRIRFPVLDYFQYEHLRPPLQGVSKECSELAHSMAARPDVTTPHEMAVGLRKLLEAKDCFVRAILPKQ